MSPSPKAPATLRQLAQKLADAGGQILKDNFRKKITVQYKEDQSPVTAIDISVERHLRSIIQKEAPHCGIIGEEESPHQEDADWIFVLDPLDGTLSYINGKPLFGLLIGIVYQGHPVYGIIDHPATQERWQGGIDYPCLFNGQKTQTKKDVTIEQATIHATSPHMFLPQQEKRFHHLRRACHSALYGSDCYAYGLLSMGLTDLVAEATMKPADFMALAPVVISAGGTITDWQGQPLKLNSDGTILAAATPSLHSQALALLSDSNT